METENDIILKFWVVSVLSMELIYFFDTDTTNYNEINDIFSKFSENSLISNRMEYIV